MTPEEYLGPAWTQTDHRDTRPAVNLLAIAGRFLQPWAEPMSMAQFSFDVGAEPLADIYRTENQARMDFGGLARVEVHGGQHGRDGSVWFNPEVCANIVRMLPGCRLYAEFPVPLEIGTCHPVQLLDRLATAWACVRWPYGSRLAYLIVYNGERSTWASDDGGDA